MADYIHADDGKLHVRFSELLRCTPGQIDQVIAARQPGFERFESDHMLFGTDRHELWKQESAQTGLVPECFRELAEGRFIITINDVEREFATEIAPGIVVHSRPDGVSHGAQVIVDYKTVVDGVNGYKENLKRYKSSLQGKFYAMQLALHNIDIRHVIYLCEIWNMNRDHILGYEYVEQQISLMDRARMRPWAIERAALLKSAMERVRS